MSHFHYCSSVWHNCLKPDSNKLDRLHERALRYLYSDESSQTSTLCDRIGYSLVDRRIQNLVIVVFKRINNYPPEYLRDLFRLRDNINNLRGVNKLQVPKPNTTRYGKNSVNIQLHGQQLHGQQHSRQSSLRCLYISTGEIC